MSIKSIDNFSKYDLVGEYNRKFDKLCFDSFDADRSIEMKGMDLNVEGLLFIKISNVTQMQIYLGSELVYKYDGFESVYIPIVVKKYETIRIVGSCGKLIILVSGYKFRSHTKNLYLTKSKTYIEDSGNYNIYRYIDVDGFVSRDLSLVKTMGGVMNAQDFSYNGNNYCAIVYENNGVYLSTEVDNYSSETYVIDNCDSIEIVNGIDNNCVGLVYMKQGVCYIAKYDISNSTLLSTDELVLTDLMRDDVICDNIHIQLNCIVDGIAAFNVSNNYMLIYDINRDKIVMKYKFSNNNTRIIVCNDEIFFIEKYDKFIKIIAYDYSYENNKYLIYQSKYIRKDNIDDCIIMDNCFIMYNCLTISKLSENEIFGNN